MKPDQQQTDHTDLSLREPFPPFLYLVISYISRQKYFFFSSGQSMCKSQNTTLQYLTFNTRKILCELLWLYYKFCTE